VNGPPKADALVYGELVYPAPLLAEKLGLRSATHITTPMSFFSAYDPPVLPPLPGFSSLFRSMGPAVNRLLIQLIKRTTRSWAEPVHRLRMEMGLPKANNPVYEGKFSPQLVLATFSSVLAQPQPDWPPNSVVTGFPFYDGDADPVSLPGPLAKFLEHGEPPIVFTLGSSAVFDPGNFYQESVEAAAVLKKRAVLLIGRNPVPERLPESVIALDYVRFSELFPRAAAVVHQGGIGTTGQSLRAGCPMLVMPFNFDQPDNAARIVRLGAGRTISRKKYSALRAAHEIRALLDTPAYTQRAKELSRCLQKENGAVTASDAIERLLLTR
jgi:UDP:flavonoid glycosyltransferase YjiC (YdhE family)